MKGQSRLSPEVYNKKLKNRALDLGLLAMSEEEIFQMLTDVVKEGKDVTADYKSRDYKRTAETHEGFGVDLHDTEPFERNLREQEGRRYLLWRKVTG